MTGERGREGEFVRGNNGSGEKTCQETQKSSYFSRINMKAIKQF